jgi:hypothetical protein
LAPGPPTAVFRKTIFLAGESSLSLLQKFLLLKSVVRSGNAHPHQDTILVWELNLTAQQTAYSVGGSDLASANVLITTENRHFFRLLEPV